MKVLCATVDTQHKERSVTTTPFQVISPLVEGLGPPPRRRAPPPSPSPSPLPPPPPRRRRRPRRRT